MELYFLWHDIVFFYLCVKNETKVYPLQGERLQMVRLIKETKHE